MNQNNTTQTTVDRQTLPADDPRATFAAAVRTARATIEQVGSDQMAKPTPCDGFDARKMIGHIAMVLTRVACAGRGEDPATWPQEEPVLADDEWLGALEEAAVEVHRVWSDDTLLARDVALPWTVLDGAQVLGIYTNELTVHTWDLATATGLSPDWDDTALQAAWEAIRSELPDAERGPMWAGFIEQMPEGIPFEPPFADAVPVADDAPFIDRLVAWNGRRR